MSIEKKHSEMIKWFLEHAWIGNKKKLTEKDKRTIKENWEDWLKYETNPDLINKERVIIAGPSHNFGLLYLPKMVNDLNTDWESYILKGVKINKGEYGNLYFDGYVFSLTYVLNVLKNYFSDKTTLELKLFKHNGTAGLAIKINVDYAIGIANKIHCDEFDDKGVTIATTEVDIDENKKVHFKILSKEYVPWNNWKAIQKENWKGREIKHFCYHKNYMFEKLEEEGDSLLI